MTLNINPDFQHLLPPLAPEELAWLRESIQAEGCRDPLVLWKGQIIDGHNRYAICTELGIEYKTREMEFESAAHARVWMRRNQGGRRNMDAAWRVKLALDSKADLIEIGQMKRRETEGRPSKEKLVSLGDTSFQGQKHSTREAIAKEAGVATGTVGMAEVVMKECPDLWQEALDGKKTIKQAYTEARKTKQLEAAKHRYMETRSATETEPKFTKADAIEWLGQQGECDLLLTDPPYMTDIEDIGAFAKSWLPLALSKVKPSGRAYVFVGAYPEELHAYLSVAMPTQILVWTYRNTLGPCAKHKYNLNWQAILYYCGPDAAPLDGPSLTERWAVQDVNAPDGRLGNRIHKWQKPDELAERIISQATRPGETVLDPFCGSGTFVLAAARLGRIAKGCDIEWPNE